MHNRLLLDLLCDYFVFLLFVCIKRKLNRHGFGISGDDSCYICTVFTSILFTKLLFSKSPHDLNFFIYNEHKLFNFIFIPIIFYLKRFVYAVGHKSRLNYWCFIRSFPIKWDCIRFSDMESQLRIKVTLQCHSYSLFNILFTECIWFSRYYAESASLCLMFNLTY